MLVPKLWVNIHRLEVEGGRGRAWRMVTASMQDWSAFSASTWKLALAADTLELLRPVDEDVLFTRKGSTRSWSSTS